MYRTNTYPFLHTGVYHLVLNLIGVLPLLERFEAGHGTLTSLALFFGGEFSWAAPSILAEEGAHAGV